MSTLNSYSQSKQDLWVDSIFDGKRNGYFVDVGAHDGILSSNTLSLERERDWSGICIEANPHVFMTLVNNRKSVLNCAVADYNGFANFGWDSLQDDGGFSVEVKTLSTILEQVNAPSTIDYISLDIEGGELNALKGLDFDRWQINALTIEHNLYMIGPEYKNQIYDFMSSKNFERIVEDAPCLDTNPAWYLQPYEDWYVNRKVADKILWKNFLI